MKKLLIVFSISICGFAGLSQSQYLVVKQANGTNTYTATVTGFSAYGGTTYNNSVRLLFTNGNTTSSTLNVNSMGPMTIQKLSSGSLVDLVSGDIVAGYVYDLTYNGSVMIINLPGTGGATPVTGSGLTWNIDRYNLGGALTGNVSLTTGSNNFMVNNDDASIVFNGGGGTFTYNGGVGNPQLSLTPTEGLTYTGPIRFVDLAGTGNRMLMADPEGDISTVLDPRRLPSLDKTSSFVAAIAEAGVYHYNITPGSATTITFPDLSAEEGLQWAFWKNADADAVVFDFDGETANGATVLPDTSWVYVNWSDGRFKVAGTNPAATPGGGGTVTSVSGTAPINVATGTTTPVISIDNAAADGSTKGAASFTAADFNATSGNISIDYTNGQAASGSNKGFLTSADWTTFNSKAPPTAIFWATPEEFGAVGDGSTNDAAAIQSAINTGKSVFFSNKNYRVSTPIIIENKTTSFPRKILGNNTVISTVSNSAIFSIQGYYVQIEGITFLGDAAAGTSQRGISIVGNSGLDSSRYANKITNCNFLDIDGAGIYVQNVFGESSTRMQGTLYVENCFARNCEIGYHCDARGEYNNFSNCTANLCTVGLQINGGNNVWMGGNLTNCTRGAYILTGTNDGHGSIIGTKINHNSSFGVQFNGLTKNFLLLGCKIYASDIYFLNSSGARLVNCEISTTTITHTNSTFCSIENSFFEDTPTVTINSGVLKTFNNTYRLGVIPAGLRGDFIQYPNITGTQIDNAGLVVENATASTSGVPVQRSPAVTWKGTAWKTAATAASHVVEFRADVLPISASAAAGTWSLTSQINGAGYSTPLFTVRDNGNTAVTQGSLTITQATSSGGTLLSLNKSGQVVLFRQEGQFTQSTTGVSLGSSTEGFNTSSGNIASISSGSGQVSWWRMTNAFSTTTATSADGIGIFDFNPTFTLNSQTPDLFFLRYNPTITGTPDRNDGITIGPNIATNGFGTMTPTSTLHTAGSFSTGYVAKTGAYTLTILDHTVEVTSGTHTQTLPTAVGIAGREYIITNSGAGVVTVGTTSSQTFVNVSATPTTLTLNQFETARVKSNGANWLRL